MLNMQLTIYAKFGINIDELLLAQPDSGEQALKLLSVLPKVV